MVFSRYMTRSGIADHMVALFLVFQGTSILFSMVLNQITFPPILWESSLFSTLCLQYLLFVDFLMRIILNSVEWYLFVVWMCISIIVIDVEHLSKCFLAISFLDKCLFRSSTHFLIEFFFVLILNCMSYLYIVDINPMVFHLQIFSQSWPEGHLFILFMVSFAVPKVFIWSHFFKFLFLFSFIYEVDQKISCCYLCQRVFCHCFTLSVL